MSNKPPNHLHKYKKANLNRDPEKEAYIVYKCMHPTCTHYVPLALAEGKLCECNRCGEPMIISKKTLNGSSGKAMAKPHCNTCIVRKESKDVAAIAEFLTGSKT